MCTIDLEVLHTQALSMGLCSTSTYFAGGAVYLLIFDIHFILFQYFYVSAKMKMLDY